MSFPRSLAAIALGPLVACGTPYTHQETLDVRSELPEISPDCVYDVDDITLDDGARVVGWVESLPEVGCRASVYASTPLVDWLEVDQAIDETVGVGRLDTVWTRASARLESLTLETDSGQALPPGSWMLVEQLLSTRSRGYGALDVSPSAALDTLWAKALDDDPGHLVGFEYGLQGWEDAELIDDIQSQLHSSDPLGPVVDLVNDSWDSDPELFLVTVASVTVPHAMLDDLGQETVVTVGLTETVELAAGLSWSLFEGE